MSINIHLAGINHYDPLCRLRLIRWLNGLWKKKGSDPAFLALEASKEIHAQLLTQRKLFRRMVENEIGNISARMVDLLVQTIYYEADAYQEVFPNANVIWLDDNRQIDNDELNNFARIRFIKYRQFLTKGSFAIKRFSKVEWSKDWKSPPTDQLNNPDFCRDFIFHDKIKKASETLTSNNWAIAIAGASHSAQRKNSLRVLLEKDGFGIHVAVLKPSIVDWFQFWLS